MKKSKLISITPRFSEALDSGTAFHVDPLSSRRSLPFEDGLVYKSPSETLHDSLCTGQLTGSTVGFRSLDSDGDDGFLVDPSADMRLDRVDRAETAMRVRAQAAASDIAQSELSGQELSPDSEDGSATVSSPAINASDSAEVTIAQ